MFRAVLLSEQPATDFLWFVFGERQLTALGKRIHRKRRDPGCQVGIDGPIAILARRGEQKLNSPFRHGMIHLSAARQTHHHETGQGCRFEETAARRLNVRQNLERSFLREIPGESGEWIPRWKMLMPGVADGDERG